MIKPFNMTREMMEDCILNSKVFRDAVIDKMMSPELDMIHSELLRLMRETGGHTNKIAFIKAIRDASEGRALAFAKAFPSIVADRHFYETPSGTSGLPPKNLGLVDAKYIAESYIKLHSPPVN
jgi:hypothetical protein